MGWVKDKGGSSVEKYDAGGKVTKKKNIDIKSKVNRSITEDKKGIEDKYSRKTEYDGSIGKGTRTVEENGGKYKETFTKTKNGKTTSEKVLRKGKKEIIIMEKDGEIKAYKNGRRIRVKKAERKWNK